MKNGQIFFLLLNHFKIIFGFVFYSSLICYLLSGTIWFILIVEQTWFLWVILLIMEDLDFWKKSIFFFSFLFSVQTLRYKLFFFLGKKLQTGSFRDQNCGNFYRFLRKICIVLHVYKEDLLSFI